MKEERKFRGGEDRLFLERIVEGVREQISMTKP